MEKIFINQNIHADSINQRIFFSGNLRYKLYNLFHNITENHTFYRPIEFLAQLGYDAFYSVRNRSIVPYFGHPNIYACKDLNGIKQHPKYRTYFHNENNNSTVGMFLGVDVIKNHSGFYVVDLNLNAGLREERRRLFDAEVDPFLVRLKEMCLENGYTKVVCFAHQWPKEYIDEFKILNRTREVIFIPASPNKHDLKDVRKMLAIPHEMEANTLYVVFNYQHTPIDLFITNQSFTSHWLNQGIDSIGLGSESMFKRVESYDSLEDVELHDNNRLPNLVIKLGGGWASQYVKVANVNIADIENFRKQFSDKKIISLFNRNFITRLRGWIGQHHKLLFQKYIPPEVNSNNQAWIVRMHLFISPSVSKMLSCNRIVSDHKLHNSVPFGIVDDNHPYIVNLHKGAHYEAIHGDEFQLMESAAEQLCQIIYHVLSNKFVVFDNN